jgi:DNA-binding transcriptional regulator YiaG
MGIKMNENEKVSGRRNGKSEPSDPPPATEWTYRAWYERNKEALSKKRKERYHKDKEYREKVLEQNKEYREKKAKEKPQQSKTKVRTPKHRKPVAMKIKIGGRMQDVNMVHVGAFARAIGRSVPTIHQWERVGLLPKTPFFLRGKDKQERLYTAEMIGVVRTVLSTRGATVSASDTAFRQEIEDGWRSLGVSIKE